MIKNDGVTTNNNQSLVLEATQIHALSVAYFEAMNEYTAAKTTKGVDAAIITRLGQTNIAVFNYGLIDEEQFTDNLNDLKNGNCHMTPEAMEYFPQTIETIGAISDNALAVRKVRDEGMFAEPRFNALFNALCLQ